MCHDAEVARGVALFLSVAIGLVLIVAAIAKIESPAASFPDVDYAAAAFEIMLSVGLVVFFTHWEIWALAAIVFALWGGFSCFWMISGIPCTCFGSWIALHPGVSFVADLAFIAVCGVVMRYLGATRRQLGQTFVFCLPIGFIGFIIGHYLHSNNLV